jgi:hypothetical protein
MGSPNPGPTYSSASHDRHLDLLTELQCNKLPEKPYTQTFADIPNIYLTAYQQHEEHLKKLNDEQLKKLNDEQLKKLNDEQLKKLYEEEQLRKLSEVEMLKQKLISYEEALEKANATIKEARTRLEQAETEKARLRKLLVDNGVITMDDSS